MLDPCVSAAVTPFKFPVNAQSNKAESAMLAVMIYRQGGAAIGVHSDRADLPFGGPSKPEGREQHVRVYMIVRSVQTKSSKKISDFSPAIPL